MILLFNKLPTKETKRWAATVQEVEENHRDNLIQHYHFVDIETKVSIMFLMIKT